MDKNQTVQAESSQESESTPAPASSNLKRQAISANFLLDLIASRPWLVWSSLTAFLVTLIAISIYSLTYAGNEEQQKQTLPPPVVQQPDGTTPQTGNPLSIWMVGAVAISCAAGSLVIYKVLNRPETLVRTPRKRAIKRSSVPVVAPRTEAPKQKPQKSPPVLIPPRSLKKPIKPIPFVEPEPVVTVLPPEESKRDESLADMMDIRKQHSLSSILRDL